VDIVVVLEGLEEFLGFLTESPISLDRFTAFTASHRKVRALRTAVSARSSSVRLG